MERLSSVVRSLQGIGSVWRVCFATYLGAGFLVIGVNHGYWNQYLAPNIPLQTSYITFAFGLEAGAAACFFTFLAVLVYVSMIDKHVEREKAASDLLGLGVAFIVAGIGFTEVLLVPGMLGVYNAGFVFFLSAIAGLAAYLHLQKNADSNDKLSPQLRLVDLKFEHSETLELFKTLAQTGLILVTGVILYALIPRYQAIQYAPGSPASIALFKGTFLTLFDIAYGVYGYVLFCIGPVFIRLQFIRNKLRGISDRSNQASSRKQRRSKMTFRAGNTLHSRSSRYFSL